MSVECSSAENLGIIVGIIWGLVVGLFLGTATLDLYINQKPYYTAQIDELKSVIDIKNDKIDNLTRQLNDLDDEVDILTTSMSASIPEIPLNNNTLDEVADIDLPPRKRYRNESIDGCCTL